MTTQKQQAANKQNAQLSTGPRSAEGKAKTRFNPVKTGAYSSNILPGEDPQDLEQLLSELNDYYEPADPVRARLVGLVGMNFFRLVRLQRAECSVLSVAMLDAQAVRERWDLEKRAPTKFSGELGRAHPGGLVMYTLEERQYMTRRRLESEGGFDPYDACLAEAFVQDGLHSGILSKIGEQIARIEGSLYRALRALEE